MITHRQRLITAYKRQQPDRVPIIIRGVNPYARYMNWRGEAHPSYKPLLDLVRQHCEVENIGGGESGFYLNGAKLPFETQVEESHKDGWRITTQRIATPHGELSSVGYTALETYEHGVRKYWISSEDDLERFLGLPFELAQPDMATYTKLDREVGDAGIILPNQNDPIGWAHSLLGSELLSLWSIEQPKLLYRLMDVLFERCMGFYRLLLEGGVHPVIGLQGQESIVPPLMAPRRFKDLVVRYDRPLVELAHQHGCLVSVHCHGCLGRLLEDFVETGIDVLHPIESPPMGDVTLREAKRRLGKAICIQGNIQMGDLMLAPRQTIIDLTKAAIDDAAPGGGFVLSISATPFERVLSPRTLDNLAALIETGLEYGKY